jgi:ribosome biogenesis GTPase
LDELFALGWNIRLEDAFRAIAHDGVEPGRVAVANRGLHEVYTSGGPVLAHVPGRLLHAGGDLPVTGDWVALRRLEDDRAQIEAVLPRATKLSRKAAGHRTDEQVLAANIDVAFCVDAVNGRFRPRRIERSVSLAWDSGAEPVVVCTKADLCEDTDAAVAQIEQVAVGVPIVVTSAVTGEGVDDLRLFLAGHRTAVLLGPSGVGKSTLINRLVGSELLETQAIREADGRGRHTTVRRELVVLRDGGLLLDTPGMRELALWDGGTSETFDDIEARALECRFRDCGHERDAGCAIQSAIADGSLDRDRYDGYVKLQRELAYLERRKDERAALDEKKRVKQLMKSVRRGPTRS